LRKGEEEGRGGGKGRDREGSDISFKMRGAPIGRCKGREKPHIHLRGLGHGNLRPKGGPIPKRM